MDSGKAAEEGRMKNIGFKTSIDTEDSRHLLFQKKLTPLEKRYLLAVEHGDINTVRKILQRVAQEESPSIDVNCVDPLGRSALLMAIDNENFSMLELLITTGVEPRDALLHAINAHFVEAVELLLEHEEVIHKPGEPHSWEKVDPDIATFTPEITPLILAAHCNNYEILKILLDRGATLPIPHDVRCGCDDCVKAVDEDSLRHSRSRINAYRALSSPSLICLSSVDPILTAFELSWELRRLSFVENEFKEEYVALRKRCQDFAVALLDHTRSSYELEVILNHDPTANDPVDHGGHLPLARLDLALEYKQKKFISHANVQQLMSTLWYEGLPGFRRKNVFRQSWDILKIGVFFPVYAWIYMLFPDSKSASLIRKPFVKFIIHSFSYLFFLFLLILASQRVEVIIIQLFGTEQMKADLREALRRQRGQKPSVIECSILIYVIAHIWAETREFWKGGILQYFQNMWNIIDFTRNSLYVITTALRLLAYIQAQNEISAYPEAAYIPREEWDAFDPMLIAEGLFAAGNVFAALKLVHIFSINPYLGPLQISLGRMVIDIIKFFFIYTLVLFAFACGLNQLLWYHADLEKQKCYDGGDDANWDKQRDSCLTWRRFSNLFESSQSLFWASFGLVDLANFELAGIKSYTRFWGLLMFGSYSVINVVVLLNLLIAMMNHSYQIISERSDTEWKFARTKLFMSYFEEGGTLPAPFNIFPTVKMVKKLLGIRKHPLERNVSMRRKTANGQDRNEQYLAVMRNLVWRYVTSEQRTLESTLITEDHVNEIRQDISTFRFEMIDVFQDNGLRTSSIKADRYDAVAKKVRDRERRLLKDFNIARVEGCVGETTPSVNGDGSKFGLLAKLSGSQSLGHGSRRWKELINVAQKSQIGSRTKSSDSLLTTESLRESLDKECGLLDDETQPQSGFRSLAKRLKQLNAEESPKMEIEEKQSKAISTTPISDANKNETNVMNGDVGIINRGRKPSLAEIYGRTPSEPSSRKPSIATKETENQVKDEAEIPSQPSQSTENEEEKPSKSSTTSTKEPILEESTVQEPPPATEHETEDERPASPQVSRSRKASASADKVSVSSRKSSASKSGVSSRRSSTFGITSQMPSSSLVEELKSRLQSSPPQRRHSTIQTSAPYPPPPQRDRAQSGPSTVNIGTPSAETTVRPPSPYRDTGHMNLGFEPTLDEGVIEEAPEEVDVNAEAALPEEPAEPETASFEQIAIMSLESTGADSEMTASPPSSPAADVDNIPEQSESPKAAVQEVVATPPSIQISPAKETPVQSDAVDSDKYPLLRPPGRIQGVSTIKRQPKFGWL